MGTEKNCKGSGFCVDYSQVGISIATSILDDKKLDMKNSTEKLTKF